MFKDSFKYFKSRNPPPDLKNVLDFQSVENTKYRVNKISVASKEIPTFFGFKPIKSWEIYEIIDCPGLVFIKNPFSPLGQRYWTVRCLKDYSKKPNKSNIDPANLIPDNKNWWDLCQSNNILLLNKLRWITLGYHHNWDTKIYSEDNRGKFPEDLKNMSGCIAQVLGYNEFSAEAAIVNYYHMDSTLSGHTDHSEKNLDAPLFSFSFGQTAIFLIGGKSIDDMAIPMFLRSGDIVVMSKESRLCYHGIPKILQTDSKMWSTCDQREKKINDEFKDIVSVCEDDNSWKPFGDYLNSSRININVRQVLYNGETYLS